MILANHGIISSSGGSLPLLLDMYSGTIAAYSLRKLNTSYTGFALRVRRSSDNTSQDIGFINNELDTTSLLSFVGSGNGFVTTLYDQSGYSKDVSQSTASLQPDIVLSGVLVTKLGKPTMRFGMASGNQSYLINNSISINSADLTFIYLANKDSIGNEFNVSSAPVALKTAGTADWNNTSSMGTRLTNTNTHFVAYNSVFTPEQSYVYNTNYLFWSQKVSNVISSGINNNTLQSATVGTSSNIVGTQLTVGANSFNNDSFLNGYIGEVIVYPSNQSANRIGISANINSFYSIY